MKIKWIICPRCEGEGVVDGTGGFTQSEWDEWTDNGQDTDHVDAYLEGHYDEICKFCKGSGKISDERLSEWKQMCEEDEDDGGEGEALRSGMIF